MTGPNGRHVRARVGSRTYRLTGSGHRERRGGVPTERWISRATTDAGDEMQLWTWSDHRDGTCTPNPDLTFIFPPVRGEMASKGAI